MKTKDYEAEGTWILTRTELGSHTVLVRRTMRNTIHIEVYDKDNGEIFVWSKEDAMMLSRTLNTLSELMK